MKKLLFVLVATLVAATASAQLQVRERTSVIRGAKTNYMFVDLYLSPASPIKDADGNKFEHGALSLGLDLGYRRIINRYLAWDIIGLGFNLHSGGDNHSESEYLVESGYLQGITAIRGTSPALTGNISVYASAGAGYGYLFDDQGGGLAYELKAGLNLTKWLSVGYRYNSQTASKLTKRNYEYGEDTVVKGTLGLHSLNLGFRF